jgi:hypothetical protein
VKLNAASGQLCASEVAVFVTSKALVTVRKDEGVAIDPVLARWDDSKDLAKHGVSFLLWGLLDDIVDGHFEAVQSLDSEIEALEDLLFDDAPHNTEVQRRSFELRKSLVLLRRLVLPMREVVNSLMRRDLHVLDQAMTPYYQDVYDHVLRNRMDGVAAGSCDHHPRDQSHDPRQQDESRDEEGHQLGGDHCRPYRRHRLLWPERALSRLCRALGILVLHSADRGSLRWSVLGIPT